MANETHTAAGTFKRISPLETESQIFLWSQINAEPLRSNIIRTAGHLTIKLLVGEERPCNASRRTQRTSARPDKGIYGAACKFQIQIKPRTGG